MLCTVEDPQDLDKRPQGDLFPCIRKLAHILPLLRSKPQGRLGHFMINNRKTLGRWCIQADQYPAIVYWSGWGLFRWSDLVKPLASRKSALSKPSRVPHRGINFFDIDIPNHDCDDDDIKH